MLLSAIVPVYSKPQEFLRECIESILGQSFADFELILVHDASPDHSLATLKSYANGDPRIQIIDLKKHSGVAAARNAGLARAKGKYVTCVDSDDIVALDYFRILVDTAEHFALDMVTSGVTNFQKTQQLQPIKPPNLEKIFRIKTIAPAPTVQHFICRLFRRSTIGALRFDENLHAGEDILFIHQAMLLSQKYLEINYGGYCYRHPPAGELEAYRAQFCSMEHSEDCGLSRRIGETLYLAQRLCDLEKFAKNSTDIAFIRYLATRRFLRYADRIWQLPSRRERIFFWEKFCEVFVNKIQSQLSHRLWKLFLEKIFAPKKMRWYSRAQIYCARIAYEIYNIRQNMGRFLNFIKLYFTGAC
ncbi:MAG: glycosyltransferase [Puniceicoccales bacterium]|jgi:glycosyltransferase involved in cell wall biosynthesis|nr:glycosyltransferase [Puniceicoccales bacterium]